MAKPPKVSLSQWEFALNHDRQILHLLGWDKKFVPPFIEFMQEHFLLENHHFIVYGEISDSALPGSQHVTHYKSLLKNLLPLLRRMRSARKIILHGLLRSHIYLALALHPWVLRKCYWVIWGGDLYIHNAKKKTWSHRMKEWLRRFVISRLGHFVTYIKGDYELAQQWYGARGEYHECLMYPSNVFDPQILQKKEAGKKSHPGLNILVGNSADPSNHHIEVLEQLLPYKDQDIKIHVPLSYGDQDHAQQVINQGKQWFGDKFVPLTSFMALDQYLCFLKNVDIAIFKHERQQAMGNTITLLGLGKTVYMRRDVSQWCFLNDIGVSLKSVSDFSLSCLSEDDASQNSKVIQSYFTKQRLIDQLSHIFRG